MAEDTPEVAAAKRAAEIAKAQFDQAKSLADLAALKLTGSTATPAAVTPLTGETKLTDVTIESRILAQKAIVAIAGEIVRRVVEVADGANPSARPTMVFYDAAAFGAVYQYRAMMLAIDELIADYGSVAPKAPAAPAAALQERDFVAAPLALATGAATAVAGLLALFRTNTEIAGKAFTPAEAVLVATLTNALRSAKPDWVIVYPPLNVPGQNPKQSALLTKLTKLLDLRQQPVTDPLDTRLTTLNDRVDRFTSGLTASDDPQRSPLAALLKAERLAKILESDPTYVLAASLHDVAGSSKTTRNLFRGTHLFFSGGALVTFFVLASDGSLRIADTLYRGTGFIEMTDASRAELTNF